MIIRVNSYNVKKDQAVTLSKELPIDRIFGNTYPIKQGSKGYVTSMGFVNGMLKVSFWSHMHGTANVEFNVLSAANFLLTDY